MRWHTGLAVHCVFLLLMAWLSPPDHMYRGSLTVLCEVVSDPMHLLPCSVLRTMCLHRDLAVLCEVSLGFMYLYGHEVLLWLMPSVLPQALARGSVGHPRTRF